MKNMSGFFIIVLLICFLGMTGITHAQQGGVIVPNVEGIKLEVAAQVLRTAGLQPRFQDTSNMSALVVQQYPRSGSALAAGSEVTLMTKRGATIQTMQMSGSVSTVPQPSSVTSTSRVIRENVVTPMAVTVTPVKTIGTDVSVTPQTPVQPYRQLDAARQQWQSEFTVVQQSDQTPANQYFVVETTPKMYPTWYPREFLSQREGQNRSIRPTLQRQPTYSSTPSSAAQSLPQSSVSPYMVVLDRQGYSTTPQVLPQSSVSPYMVVDTSLQHYTGWYAPQGAAIQHSYPQSQPSGVLQSNVYQSGVTYTQTQTAMTSAVPVPNVTRLRQEDAIFAIRKAGLSVGSITGVQQTQLRAGLIMRQSPRPRAIVPAGTRVDLWITY